MPITKEQFELFDKNFEVIETTKDISEYRANLDFDDIINHQENYSSGDYFLDVNWDIKNSEPYSSDGYSIIKKYPEQHIKNIYDLEDVIIFINDEMDQYLEKKEIKNRTQFC